MSLFTNQSAEALSYFSQCISAFSPRSLLGRCMILSAVTVTGCSPDQTPEFFGDDGDGYYQVSALPADIRTNAEPIDFTSGYPVTPGKLEQMCNKQIGELVPKNHTHDDIFMGEARGISFSYIDLGPVGSASKPTQIRIYFGLEFDRQIEGYRSQGFEIAEFASEGRYPHWRAPFPYADGFNILPRVRSTSSFQDDLARTLMSAMLFQKVGPRLQAMTIDEFAKTGFKGTRFVDDRRFLAAPHALVEWYVPQIRLGAEPIAGHKYDAIDVFDLEDGDLYMIFDSSERREIAVFDTKVLPGLHYNCSIGE